MNQTLSTNKIKQLGEQICENLTIDEVDAKDAVSQAFNVGVGAAIKAMLELCQDESNQLTILEAPLSIEQMRAQKNESNFVSGIIRFDIHDAINNDFEEFLDLIAERLTGSPLLMEIDYTIVGTDEQAILIKVAGDVSGILHSEEDDNDNED